MRVDPGNISTRQEFASALTALREAAGLTVREVARASGLSPSTVGGYFSGRHLPPLRPDGGLRPILTACGVLSEEDLAVWQLALSRIRRGPGPRPGALPPPYLGLSPYGEEDAGFFFGRDKEIEALTTVLGTPAGGGRQRGLVTLLGPTGSGKTSLALAGVVPRLRAAGHPVTVLTADRIPPGALAAARHPEGHHGPGSPHPVLIVDQLERLPSRIERGALAHELAGTAAGPGGPSVLAVLRSEAAGSFSLYLELADAVRTPALVLSAPDAGQMRSIVAGPARTTGLDVDDDLVDAVVTDALLLAGRGTQPLPRVSHALLATWQHGRRTRMSLTDYREVGGVPGSIEAAAEEIHRSLPDFPRRRPASSLWKRASSTVVELARLARLVDAVGLSALRRGSPARSSGRPEPRAGR